MSELDSRLLSLERRQRLLACVVVVLLTVILVGSGGGQSPPVSAEVRSKRFVLVDAKNNVRASLGINEDNGTLFELFDHKGKGAIAFEVYSTGARTFMMSDPGGLRASLVTGPINMSVFSLSSAKDKSGVHLVQMEEGTGIRIDDTKGHTRATLTTRTIGTHLMISDQNKVPRAEFGEAFSGQVDLKLRDQRSKLRTSLQIDPNGNSGLGVFGPDQLHRLNVGVDTAGVAGLNIFDKKANRRISGFVGPGGPPSFVLFHQNQVPAVRQAVENGSPKLEIQSPDGSKVWSRGKD